MSSTIEMIQKGEGIAVFTYILWDIEIFLPMNSSNVSLKGCIGLVSISALLTREIVFVSLDM